MIYGKYQPEVRIKVFFTFSASSRLQGKRLVTDTVEFSQREQDVDL